MPNNDAEEERPPETQAEVEGGGSGKPPRRTAVGLGYFGESQPSKKGSSMWQLYCSYLARYFKTMDRVDQEQLIIRLCQVVTVAWAIALTTFFYLFVPLLVRVFVLPLFLVGSWFVATRVVAPIAIAELEPKLNLPCQ